MSLGEVFRRKLYDSGVMTPDWDQLREDMVEKQLRVRGVRDERVLDSMRAIPRHIFLPEELRTRAYTDRALAVGYGQTISQPYIVGMTLQALALTGKEKVLEVGTGTGYQAALLGKLASQVETVDLIPELVEEAWRIFAALKITNVTAQISDGTLGLPKKAPFDAIVVAAAAPDVPAPLIDQLAPGGRLIIPLGNRTEQYLTLFYPTPSGLEKRILGACAYVPLMGRYGWTGMSN